MAIVSQAIFDDLLKQGAIAADGKSVLRTSVDGNRYPEGEVFTVEKVAEPTPRVESPPKKPPNPPKEVKADAANPINN